MGAHVDSGLPWFTVRHHINFSGSVIGKILLFDREINPNCRIMMILVNEKLGL